MSLCPNTNKLIVSGKQTRIIKRFFFFELGIKPHYNSRYDLTLLFQLLLYAHSNGLSAEEASQQMKFSYPDSMVASADTLLRRLKQADLKKIKKAFNSTTKRIIKSLPKKRFQIAIDYHDIPYYGNKNDVNVKGTKRKAGTNYCHKFTTLEIIEGNKRLTLAVKKLSVNDDSKAEIIKELIQTTKKYIQISQVFLDREFFNVNCIRILKKMKVKFIIPAIKNKKVQKYMREQSCKIPITTPYTIGTKNDCETFNLCLVREKRNEDNKNRPSSKPLKVFGFATNIQTDNAEYIAEEYRKRWSIETGYKSKKKFRTKTSTRNNIIRLIYFYMECLLYNAWCQIRNTKITIETFKKIIEQTATKIITNPSIKDT